MLSIKRTFFCYLDEFSLITILVPYSYHRGMSASFLLKDDVSCSPLSIESVEKLQHFVKYSCRTDRKISLGSKYEIEDEHHGITDLQIGAVIRTKAFDETFYYDGPLGVDFSTNESSFYLWAPTAQQVKLVIQDPNEATEKRRLISMNRIEKGVWTTTVKENLEGFFYSYHVLINLEWREAIDPYAVAVSVNGITGVIVDLRKTKKVKPSLPPLESYLDSIIYEAHIRDLTIHPESGIQRKGSYLGVTELDTKTKEQELSGLSYIKDLGITHLEFLPVHDFEEVDELEVLKKYNWGYNPSHYNVPEGSYSSDPTDPYVRINELKDMIHDVQSQGIRVILDVVYNHVYKKEDSPFEKILPGYFFRYDRYGMPSNGTGVGNDIASERLMVRRFIVDSVRFWMEEYQIDGLRFDLMGILDIETMQRVRELCDKIDPSILIIGEGWNLPTPIQDSQKATIMNQGSLPRIGQFNDQFRDKIKGSTFNFQDLGYSLGNKAYTEAVKDLLAGSVGAIESPGIFTQPEQSVNYVESHDNHTLWDKIEGCFPNISELIKQKKHRLATSLVLLSQGIPFLHSGQEFFRTKYGVENSYQSPDEINQLDWNRKDYYKQNVEFIKRIIHVRKSNQVFRLRTTEEIRKYVQIQIYDEHVIAYRLQQIEAYGLWKTIIIYINPGEEKVEQPLENGKWKTIVENEDVFIDSYPEVEGKITIEPISFTMVAM